ncbi:hypothetical protein DTO027I6_6121 [Penicillium roqueforti]|nr:hypothetical protein DTO027I6_6121 [Penicillium roqueforti]
MGSATPYPWNQYPELRDRYRGFRTALRVLANEPNSVSQLVMTSNSIPTGINCAIFDEPCEEYNHFATVLKKPGFRRLDIALLLGGDVRKISKHAGDLCLMGVCAGHSVKQKKRKSSGCIQHLMMSSTLTENIH